MPNEAWTWQQFIDAARKLSQSNPDGSLKRYGAGTRGYWLEWLAWVWSNGGDIFDADGMRQTLTYPANLSALQAIAEEILIRECMLYNTNINYQVEQLVKGNTSMYVDLSWRWNVIGQTDANIGVAPVPHFGEPTALLSGSPRMIMANTKHPWEAWLLYKWLQDPAKSLPYFRDGGAQPVSTSWLSQPSLWKQWQGNRPDSWYYASNMNAAMYGRPHPGFYMKNWGEIINPIDRAVQTIFRGEQSAQMALEQVANAVATQLKGRLDR
jgi:multiple sugar transport system substrate-binding protein